MKNLIVVFIFLGSILLISCSTKAIMGSVEAYNQSIHKDGTLVVKSWVTGNAKKNDLNAAKNALEKVLFYGISDTAVKRPLYQGDRTKHQDYFEKLLNNPFPFVSVGAFSAEDRFKTSSGIKTGTICIVKYKSLLKKLEQDKILKQFGK